MKQVTRNRRAFTLIELLVVVLIIGILAAVAVPQYRKAVVKARYAELKSLATGLYQAEKVYHLANGFYTTRFSDLDVNIRADGGNVIREGTLCSLDSAYVVCINSNINMAYRMNFTGERACVAYDSDKTSAGHQVCKAETGRSGPSEGYSSTYFYS